MDRRSFLRSSAVVLRSELPNGLAFGGEGKISRVVPILQGYQDTARSLIFPSGTDLDWWSCLFRPMDPRYNAGKATQIKTSIGIIATKITNLIGRGDTQELYDAIFILDRHIGCQIFCQYFSQYTKEQRKKVLEFLFPFKQRDWSNRPEMTDLGEVFFEVDFQEAHPTLIDTREYFSQWLHNTSDSDYEAFLEAIPDFIEGSDHFHTPMREFLCYFCDAHQDMETKQDFIRAVKRIVQFFTSVSDAWKKFLVEILTDDLSWISIVEGMELYPEIKKFPGMSSLSHICTKIGQDKQALVESLGGYDVIYNNDTLLESYKANLRGIFENTTMIFREISTSVGEGAFSTRLGLITGNVLFPVGFDGGFQNDDMLKVNDTTLLPLPLQDIETHAMQEQKL